MIEKDDISYGVVPLYKDGGIYKVLLVHQISYRGDRFWIFPKGHAEADEQPFETAKRELGEETGVTEITLEPEITFSVTYSFVHDEVRINKRVEYYVGYCQSMATSITEPQEIAELRWCTLDEAQELLTHKNSREVLDQVSAYLEK